MPLPSLRMFPNHAHVCRRIDAPNWVVWFHTTDSVGSLRRAFVFHHLFLFSLLVTRANLSNRLFVSIHLSRMFGSHPSPSDLYVSHSINLSSCLYNLCLVFESVHAEPVKAGNKSISLKENKIFSIWDLKEGLLFMENLDYNDLTMLYLAPVSIGDTNLFAVSPLYPQFNYSLIILSFCPFLSTY